jgi:hypothetical protein
MLFGDEMWFLFSLHLLKQLFAYIHMYMCCHALSDYRRALDWWLYVYLLHTYTTRFYTSQITITHKLVFSVTLSANGCQRSTFLCFCAHVLAGWRPSHANLISSLQTVNWLSILTAYCKIWTLQSQVKVKSKSRYDRWSVGQSVLVSSPVWGSWPDINYCLTRGRVCQLS